MKLVFISDTHNRHDEITILPCDILVHCGDATVRGNLEEIGSFAEWFERQPATTRIFVPGNHDILFQTSFNLAHSCFSRDTIIETRGRAQVGALSFWLDSWSPEYGPNSRWAFHYPRGRKARDHWIEVPSNIDILVTHGPPALILDRTSAKYGEVNAGCFDLLDRLCIINPKIHAFGHIHDSHGELELRAQFWPNPTHFINAAICDDNYRVAYQPIVVEI